MRITVGDKISLTDPVKAAHAAVGSALDADILPQVIVAQDHFQDLQRTCVGCPMIDEITGAGHVLNLGSCLEALFLLLAVDHAGCPRSSVCKEAFLYLFYQPIQAIQAVPGSSKADHHMVPPENLPAQCFKHLCQLIFSLLKVF